MPRMLMTIGLVVMLAACASVPSRDGVSPELRGDAARPAHAARWVRSELYFATGAVAGRDASALQAEETRWRGFLDTEVTPRFPDGLTVLDGYGQWLNRTAAAPAALHSKVLVILHPDTPEHRARIDELRVAWKRATGDVSVLWSRQPVEVSF